MSKSKHMIIAFASGGIVPAAQSASGKEERVAPHRPVKVDADYGRSLIADRFAYETSADAKSRGKSTETGDATATLEAAKVEAAAIIDKATTEANDLTAKAKDEAIVVTDAANKEADEVREAAKVEAGTIIDQANTEAGEITAKAKDEANSVVEAAKAEADEIRKAANAKDQGDTGTDKS